MVLVVDFRNLVGRDMGVDYVPVKVVSNIYAHVIFSKAIDRSVIRSGKLKVVELFHKLIQIKEINKEVDYIR